MGRAKCRSRKPYRKPKKDRAHRGTDTEEEKVAKVEATCSKSKPPRHSSALCHSYHASDFEASDDDEEKKKNDAKEMKDGGGREETLTVKPNRS